MTIGTKVRFKTSWDVFSCGIIIDAGQEGVIVDTENAGQLLGVKMDHHYPNLDEWDNIVWLDAEISPHSDIIAA